MERGILAKNEMSSERKIWSVVSYSNILHIIIFCTYLQVATHHTTPPTADLKSGFTMNFRRMRIKSDFFDPLRPISDHGMSVWTAQIWYVQIRPGSLSHVVLNLIYIWCFRKQLLFEWSWWEETRNQRVILYNSVYPLVVCGFLNCISKTIFKIFVTICVLESKSTVVIKKWIAGNVKKNKKYTCIFKSGKEFTYCLVKEARKTTCSCSNELV